MPEGQLEKSQLWNYYRCAELGLLCKIDVLNAVRRIALAGGLPWRFSDVEL